MTEVRARLLEKILNRLHSALARRTCCKVFWSFRNVTTSLLIAFVLVLTLNAAIAKNHTDRTAPEAQPKNLVERPKAVPSKRVYRQGNIVVELYSNSLGVDSVKAYNNRKLLFHTAQSTGTDSRFTWLIFPYASKQRRPVHTFDGGIDDFISADENSASSPFVHLDRNSVVNLIVAHNLGNAATIYKIYSLQGRGKEEPAISATRSKAHFIDIDHDGICEVVTSDPIFFGWKTSNADSPMPIVVLKLDHKRFKLASTLMRANSPSESRQQEILNNWRKICTLSLAGSNQTSERLISTEKTFKLSPVVWRDMLNLIYSGNSSTAFNLLDKFWGPSCYATNLEVRDDCREVRTSKKQFEIMFLNKLSESEYLEGLKVLNNQDAHIQALGSQKTHASSI